MKYPSMRDETIIVPLITGVVALAVGAALLIGKIKGRKKTTGNINEEA